MRGSGSPRTDAQFDFTRARRRRAVQRLSNFLRREPGDVNVILPFDEVVAALGYVSERRLGLQVIQLDTIVGTVDRTREFDRSFRPTTVRTRARWERIAAAHHRGEVLPPIDVLRVGEMHFVRDGHHRVSVARQLGLETINAMVTEVITRISADSLVRPRDLALKSHQRLFSERVPLPPADQARIQLSDEWRYAALAEGVEAWGFRLIQERGQALDRRTVARLWFDEEYLPVVRLLKEAELIGGQTETEAYIRMVSLRYLLLRTHSELDDELIERLRAELARPAVPDEDTLVHRLRQETPGA
jgi:hypothetical protein